ncbi:unnamed protein product, partial [Allacma fusca]
MPVRLNCFPGNANVYRFSISWPRILPNGDASEINQAGVDYYNRLIDALLENGIVPLATIYHWDMPQAIAEKFNWLAEELVMLFTDFARVCFASFGDRVKHWITINEPWIHAVISYDIGLHPPFIHDAGAVYKVVHNLLKAHAAAYRMYEAEFKVSQRGKVGISLDSWGLEPADPNSEEDLAATERAWQFKLGCVAHPIVYGEYPPLMREIVDQKSKNEGLTVSRLPDFDDEWKAKIKGSFDFIGFNHYSCEKVTTPEHAPNNVKRIIFSSSSEVGYDADQDNFRFHDSDWPTAESWWLKFTPWAIRSVLNFFKDRYGNPEIIVTENGWSDGREVIEDYGRLYYYKAYLNEVLKAINVDGCNVTGYCAWTLLDSWEWTAGHTVSFGLHYVDLDDPLRKRIPRASAKYLAEVLSVYGCKWLFLPNTASKDLIVYNLWKPLLTPNQSE